MITKVSAELPSQQTYFLVSVCHLQTCPQRCSEAFARATAANEMVAVF